MGPQDSKASKLATNDANFIAYDYSTKCPSQECKGAVTSFIEKFCNVLKEQKALENGDIPDESRSDGGGNGRRKRTSASHLKRMRKKNKADHDEFLRRKRFGTEMF